MTRILYLGAKSTKFRVTKVTRPGTKSIRFRVTRETRPPVLRRKIDQIWGDAGDKAPVLRRIHAYLHTWCGWSQSEWVGGERRWREGRWQFKE